MLVSGFTNKLELKNLVTIKTRGYTLPMYGSNENVFNLFALVYPPPLFSYGCLFDFVVANCGCRY